MMRQRHDLDLVWRFPTNLRNWLKPSVGKSSEAWKIVCSKRWARPEVKKIQNWNVNYVKHICLFLFLIWYSIIIQDRYFIRLQLWSFFSFQAKLSRTSLRKEVGKGLRAVLLNSLFIHWKLFNRERNKPWQEFTKFRNSKNHNNWSIFF